jgi:hypothetical protein
MLRNIGSPDICWMRRCMVARSGKGEHVCYQRISTDHWLMIYVTLWFICRGYVDSIGNWNLLLKSIDGDSIDWNLISQLLGILRLEPILETLDKPWQKSGMQVGSYWFQISLLCASSHSPLLAKLAMRRRDLEARRSRLSRKCKSWYSCHCATL